MRNCFFATSIFTIIALYSSSCITDFGDETFVIRVDSVSSPTTIHLNETIVFRLHGFVGPDGRYSFSHIDEKRSQSQVEITLWGRKRDAGTFSTGVIYLENTEYRTGALRSGQFILSVHQPDGTLLKDTVLVQ